VMANHLRKKVNLDEWKLTVVDQYAKHYYQPGFLFMPFGLYSEKDVVKPKRKFIPRGVEYLEAQVERIDADGNHVFLASGEALDYHLLIIATGAKTAPNQTEGMLASDWRKRGFDFYIFEGDSSLNHALRLWKVRRLVIHMSE